MPGAEGGGDTGAARGLQFDTAEVAVDAVRVCARCKRPIVDQYFESVGNIVCQSCADLLGAGAVGGGAFRRALLYGVGASLLGTIVWYGFTKLTGSELGIIAIAVGLLVGIAVRRGSGGQGGWKYQALAMALTYVSITSSYVPDVLTGFANGAEHRKQEAAKKSEASGAPSEGVNEAPSTKATAGAVVLAVVLVFAVALAAPFLAGAGNIMGLIIIGIALYEAWKINRRVPLTGPFRIAARAQAPPVAVGPPASSA